MNKYEFYYQTCFLFLFFSISSCESKVPNCGMLVEDLLKSNIKNIFPINVENGSMAFRDKGRDSIGGGYYTFYKNGQLQEYVFFKSADTVIYKEQYDSLGYLMHLDGTPLIYKSAELIHDSLLLSYYLLSLKNEYNSIKISINKSKPISLDIESDTLFSNVQVAKYIVKGISKEQDIMCHLNIEYKNECTHEIKILTDNINFHYKP